MIFLHVKKHFAARASEWMLAGILISIGLMFLRPEPMFDNTSFVYVGLERVASEQTWGWFCFTFGAIRFAALVINGAWVPSSYHLRAFTAFVACFFWFQLSFSLIMTGRPSILLAIVPWLFVLDMINCHRAAADVQKDKLLNPVE